MLAACLQLDHLTSSNYKIMSDTDFPRDSLYVLLLKAILVSNVCFVMQRLPYMSISTASRGKTLKALDPLKTSQNHPEISTKTKRVYLLQRGMREWSFGYDSFRFVSNLIASLPPPPLTPNHNRWGLVYFKGGSELHFMFC